MGGGAAVPGVAAGALDELHATAANATNPVAAITNVLTLLGVVNVPVSLLRGGG